MKPVSPRLVTGVAAVFAYGCAAILSIPDEVTRAGDDSGASEASAEAASDAGDGSTDTDANPSDGGDAGDTSDASSDADMDAACDLSKDFGMPMPITSINTASDEGSARLTDDELTIFFDAQRGDAKFDVFAATRATIESPFGMPVAIPGSVNTADHEFSPNLTPNGLRIFFERQPDFGGVSKLYTATRATTVSAFDPPTALDTINSNAYTANPYVRGTGTEIWYVSNTSPASAINMYSAQRLMDGGYTGALLANVNENNLAIQPSAPVVTKDGLTLYFASNKAGTGFLGVNIWTADRPNTNADFSAPKLVANVNGDTDEQPTWISVDGCRLYIASNRLGGAGKQDLYVATRPK